ncbi:MAG: DUF4159 domain-containing protein [Planctomycetes bacterium]|nr:DUF4159 domain-containing protein [Planctomycetota bacterium]
MTFSTRSNFGTGITFAAAAILLCCRISAAGPNLMAIGDYGSVPFKRADGKVSYSGREAIFSFDDERFNFGRVIVRSNQPLSVVKRDLFVGFSGNALRIDTQANASTGGSGAQIQELEIWLRIQGKLQPGFSYEWEFLGGSTSQQESEGFPALIPLMWADGEPIASEVTISTPESEDTDRIQRLLLPHGVVKLKSFEAQTGEAWVVLKPRNFGSGFALVRFSLREVDTQPKSDSQTTMPAPVRYIEIRSGVENQIAAVLERGTELIKRQQNAEHFWPGADAEQSVLITSLATAVLAYQDPNDERVKGALEWLARQPESSQGSATPGNVAANQLPSRGPGGGNTPGWSVLVAATRLNTLATFGGMSKFGAVIQKDAVYLSDAQNDDGGWGQRSRKEAANAAAQTSNNNESIFALLALRAARYAGAEPEKQVWKKALQYWTEAQLYDGGFNQKLSRYGGVGLPPTAAYTATGTAGLIAALDMNACFGSKRCNTFLADAAQLRAITRGLDWLNQNFQRGTEVAGDIDQSIDPLLGSERLRYLASISGMTEFNGKNSFEEEAKELLAHYDQASGMFGIRGPNNSFREAPSLRRTAECLHVLIAGVAPTICQRIIVGDADNNHAQLRMDMDHATDFIALKRGKPFNWRRASVHDDVRRLAEVPITLLNFISNAEFGDGDWAKIKEYCLSGGTVVVNVSDDNQRSAVAAAIQKAFPENTLGDVPSDAPVFGSGSSSDPVPGLKSLSNGFRMFLFLAPKDWSCSWHMNQVAESKESFTFMNALIDYVTDGMPLRSSFAPSTYAVTSSPARTMKARRSQIGSKVTAYPNLISTMDRLMQANFRTKVAEVESASEADLTWINVAGDAAPTPSEKEALVSALHSDKFVLIDVVSGNEKWDQAFRAVLQQSDPNVRLERLRRNDPLFTGEVPGTLGFDATRVRFRKALQTRLASEGRCDLWAIIRGGKPIGVYSTYDLSSGIGYNIFPGCRGIVPEDARALAMNAFLTAYEWKNRAHPPT